MSKTNKVANLNVVKKNSKNYSKVSALSPREIVSELDRYVIGQKEAKKAVAVALRNRWRRQALSDEMRDEVLPKNILMIGPTGVGKTEISRRLSKLAQAPFIKVEATRFTEVGYVGRDVEQIIRDLIEIAIAMEKERKRKEVKAKAELKAEELVLDALVGNKATVATRESFRKRLRNGDLDENEILDLLGNKKKIKEVLRISKNRSKIISAVTFITAMMSFGAGKVMTAKGISTLKTLATLGIANVPAEMAIEGLALQAQGKDLKDVKSVEDIMLEGLALQPTTVVASLASTTKAVNQSNINRKAKRIAVENGFSLADVFSGKANGTGVEIIKTGIDQGQMQLSLSSLIQNKEITI